MLTRRAAVAEIAKLQAQLQAQSDPTESRRSLRERAARSAKRNHELEKLLKAQEAKIQRSEDYLLEQLRIIAHAKEFMTEEGRVEFEIWLEQEMSK